MPRVYGRDLDLNLREHVIVSYNGDLRGIVEELLGKSRKIRGSVSSFAHIGALIDGTAMLATVPTMVARQIRTARPHLATKPLPFAIPSFSSELLWPAATDDDEPCKYVRGWIRTIAAGVTQAGRGGVMPARETANERRPSR